MGYDWVLGLERIYGPGFKYSALGQCAALHICPPCARNKRSKHRIPNSEPETQNGLGCVAHLSTLSSDIPRIHSALLK